MSSPLQSGSFEFYFPASDTLVRVENEPDAVIIRMSRDTFSDVRKRAFVRELAAEGFIPEEYTWTPLGGTLCPRGVQWLCDISWLKTEVVTSSIARRYLLTIFSISFVLWFTIMAFAVVHYSR